ncbi:hypothetical protein EDB19DRAFT_1834986 [Suillus lakei]|nr:hypothetical protein EDB19DRAFT_1834986 [Suillus lakei]
MLGSTPLSVNITEDTPSAWKSLEVNQAVLTFANNFWAVEDAAQVDYITKDHPDNDNKVMRCLKVANVVLAYPGLVEVLFGPESFTEDDVVVKEPVRHFLDALMAHHWAKNRKSIGHERGRLGKLKNKVDGIWKEFLSMAEQSKCLDAECIRTWLKDVDGLTKILTWYGNQELLKQLSEQQETLSDLLQGWGIDVNGGSMLHYFRDEVEGMDAQPGATSCHPHLLPRSQWDDQSLTTRACDGTGTKCIEDDRNLLCCVCKTGHEPSQVIAATAQQQAPTQVTGTCWSHMTDVIVRAQERKA